MIPCPKSNYSGSGASPGIGHFPPVQGWVNWETCNSCPDNRGRDEKTDVIYCGADPNKIVELKSIPVG